MCRVALIRHPHGLLSASGRGGLQTSTHQTLGTHPTPCCRLLLTLEPRRLGHCHATRRTFRHVPICGLCFRVYELLSPITGYDICLRVTSDRYDTKFHVCSTMLFRFATLLALQTQGRWFSDSSVMRPTNLGNVKQILGWKIFAWHLVLLDNLHNLLFVIFPQSTVPKFATRFIT